MDENIVRAANMTFTGRRAASPAWDLTGNVAARIEHLELRLEVEKLRNTLQELSSMLADYQRDNQRLRERIYAITGERPVPVKASQRSATALYNDVGAAAPANALSSPFGSLIAAAELQVHDRTVSRPSWVNSLQDQQCAQQVVGAGRRGLRSSCDFCTRSKIRCDGCKPKCSNCQSRGTYCHYSEKRRPGPRSSRCPEPVDDSASQRHTFRRRLLPHEYTNPSSVSGTTTHVPRSRDVTRPPAGMASLVLASSLSHSYTDTHARTHTKIRSDMTHGAAAMSWPAGATWSISFDHAKSESSSSSSPLHAPDRPAFRF